MGFLRKIKLPNITLPLFVSLISLGLFLLVSKNASAENGNNSLILRLSLNKQTGQITIDRSIRVRNSVASHVYPPVKPSESTHRLEVLADGINIYNVPLRFIDKIHAVPPLPRSGETFGSPPFILESPVAIVTIPYRSNMTFRVRDLEKWEVRRGKVDNEVGSGKEKNLTSHLNNLASNLSPLTSTPPPSDGYFDILFVSSHYTDRTKFYSDAGSMGDFLLTVAPASDLKSKIRIQKLFTTENLGCGYDTFITRLITCDEMKVFEVAAVSTYDAIVVVENNNKYGGSGGLIAVSYRDINQWAKEVVVHEMGHSVGDLADEYEYGYNWNGKSDPGLPNCSTSPCKWQGTSDTGCYKGCSYNNLYRPTFNSCLMRTLTPDNGFKFDNVDREVMRNIISSYLIEIPPTPTPTLPVLQPTSTPSLTPSPTPLPTKKPTPTIKWYKPKSGIILPTLRPTISFLKPSPIKLRGR